jgi:uncharacterized zinc-type alcohol dehydrogenase-like protein
MSKTKGYAAASPKVPLVPFTFDRREAREHDVVIDIKYCGVCHSDIHQTRKEWGDFLNRRSSPDRTGARDRCTSPRSARK